MLLDDRSPHKPERELMHGRLLGRRPGKGSSAHVFLKAGSCHYKTGMDLMIRILIRQNDALQDDKNDVIASPE